MNVTDIKKTCDSVTEEFNKKSELLHDATELGTYVKDVVQNSYDALRKKHGIFLEEYHVQPKCPEIMGNAAYSVKCIDVSFILL